MTPEDMRQHSRAWLLASMKLKQEADAEILMRNGEVVISEIQSEITYAMIDLARAVSNSYAEIAGE